MIDRIEELLADAAAEEDDEGQEDVPALTDGLAVPASPHGDGGEAGEAPKTADEEAVLAPVELGERGGGRSAGDIAADRPGLIAGAGETEPSPAAGGETAEDENGRTAGELWKDGPVWTAQSVEPAVNAVQELAESERIDRAAETLRAAVRQDVTETLRTAADRGMEAAAVGQITAEAETGAKWSTQAETARAEVGAAWTAQTESAGVQIGAAWTAQAETAEAQIGAAWTAQAELAETSLAGARRMTAVQAGLEGLYRQTVAAARPAVPALAPEQAGRMVRAQEPGSAASLAVDELDRAVRRDSRRYDGGMSIF